MYPGNMSTPSERNPEPPVSPGFPLPDHPDLARSHTDDVDELPNKDDVEFSPPDGGEPPD
ncbi:hypothetical protein GCM10009754_09630 [Amycolatopsis minnesotensis]|uniref:Uncharacterized protein n=2 Tax=Amycolatopsis minnesotensis TaxID=337894 RepID=A0ABP5BG15_9PSEU